MLLYMAFMWQFLVCFQVKGIPGRVRSIPPPHPTPVPPPCIPKALENKLELTRNTSGDLQGIKSVMPAWFGVLNKSETTIPTNEKQPYISRAYSHLCNNFIRAYSRSLSAVTKTTVNESLGAYEALGV